ncbi:MAG: TIGR01212 family radical SAM protein [Candidatus Neomarinimicrobiota bacterium]|nr:MAG: TIGR01212 family radical SAM protein [Candidatus Neomarinimicrobiota bacterium]
MSHPFPREERYYHYSRYLRERFNSRVYKISLDAGFTCPTRNGTISYGGCLYCNNNSFALKRKESILPITQQIAEGVERLKKYRKAKKFLAYFQAFTNTYAPVEELEKLYNQALSFPDIVGLCIGTRPDCVDDEIFELLQDLNRESYVSIEFGIESVYDKTLKWVKRGHDFSKIKWAVNKSKEYGLHTSGHLIFGFPTESSEEILESAEIINNLGIDAIKIHHLHIVKNTQLAKLYKEKPFHVFTESEWIELVCDFLERLSPSISIQRLCSEAKQGTLIAPLWKLSKSEVIQGIQRELERRGSYQGFNLNCKN